MLDRNFDVEEVNTVWVSDITYILTDEGWRYLTVILDLADRGCSELDFEKNDACAMYRRAGL
ncbi:MAG: hypothetical protein IPH31_23815 [Lewinellaceae bacterium]|nr:hypothetical protein [Lewinellaceae bacterium]